VTGAGHIDSLSADTLPRSGYLEILGSNFGGGGQVRIDGLAAPVADWTGNRIVAYVPEAAGLSSVPVQVTNASGQASNSLSMIVTNRVADATTGFGGGYGPNVGVGFLLTGYVLRDWNVRETGREILEAGFLSHLLDKYVLKTTFGRERPFESDGETRFHFFSSHDSFPSGHATEAFSIASVVAMRSKGWVLPTLAYTAATLVCFDRVNDHVHFASDVVAGAVLGTAVGRFIVARHRRAQEQKPTAEFDVVPIRGGLAARLAF